MAVALDDLITPDIQQPARYLGNELGSVHKSWDAAAVRWVLTYPEVYEVGASNLGHIILYNILNTQPRQLCDRAYLPASDLGTKLRTAKIPLFAVESKQPLTAFDILGFSLSYELGATNILEMLDLAGIPLTWKERNQQLDSAFPLIFAGGQTATSNPEPYADFFDFFALGDGEELLPEIGLVLEEGKARGLSREDLLLDLAQIPGVYVPQFYEMTASGAVQPLRPDIPARILRRVATPIPAYSIGLVPYVQTVHDRLTVEIRRGCTRGCRFCQPGMLTRPARDVEPEQAIEAIEQGMRATGYNEFSLLSLSCSDYLALPAVGMEIKNRLSDQNISLSLPSQRVDRFDENIAHIIGGTRQGSLTFAPEAGTQRMRDIINKGLTNEELLRGIKTAVEQGWDKIKLYFMIGLPGETDADVLGIAETVRWLQRECRMSGRRLLNFNLTISNFTPKPHTPFQWHSVATAEFERKQALLKAEIRRLKGVKANFTDVRISAMEDFIGRGDRRLGPVVRRAWELGAGMDSWWESLERAFGAWTQAIEEAGLTWKYRQVEQGEWNAFETVAGNTAPATTATPSLETPPPTLDPSWQQLTEIPLPWDHLDTGIDKTWLKADLQRALAATTVPDCSFDGCSHCGVCGTDFGHNQVAPVPPMPAFVGQSLPNSARIQRLRVWFGKLGSMALVSHLDLVRLFDRALRRASLPISFSGGFHPSPRISPANALPLGVTSTGEIVDFELAEAMDIQEFRERLMAQLSPEMPIYRIEEVDVKSPSATQLLERAEYFLAVDRSHSKEDRESEINATINPRESDLSRDNWVNWIEAVKAADAFWWEQTTKSGKKQMVNLRERLFELELVLPSTETIPSVFRSIPPDIAILRYVGSCRNDGTLLRPEQVLYTIEQVSQQGWELLQVHRQQLLLGS